MLAASTAFCVGCAAYNFDHPDAFDTAAMLECLNNLKVCPLAYVLGLVVSHEERPATGRSHHAAAGTLFYTG